MCGIVGLHLKSPALEVDLGRMVVPMIETMASRGTDSTGLAVYSRSRTPGETKYSLGALADSVDWDDYAALLREKLGTGTLTPVGRGAVVQTSAHPRQVLPIIENLDERVDLFGYGADIEVFKDLGPAATVCAEYGIAARSGYQAIGHTRMATESAVTIAHSHPFSTGPDVALVHNGSFSNYNTIRRDLVGEGVQFDTDNDTEVAARFVAHRMSLGDDLGESIKRLLKVLDGFFTLVVATEGAMAVVRDSFACKPLVVAETEAYVAVASEYIALTALPAIAEADIYEPAPEEVYIWRS